MEARIDKAAASHSLGRIRGPDERGGVSCARYVCAVLDATAHDDSILRDDTVKGVVGGLNVFLFFLCRPYFVMTSHKTCSS